MIRVIFFLHDQLIILLVLIFAHNFQDQDKFFDKGKMYLLKLLPPIWIKTDVSIQ